MGPTYLRYSFTKGTQQEVAFLIETLELQPGMRVLDVGCGPGRHSYAFAERGIHCHGVDISQRFVDIATEGAPRGATFQRLDARNLCFDQEFDAAISLCQGAFGLAGMPGGPVPLLDPDGVILEAIARSVKPGGAIAVSAFSAYFQVQYLDDPADFDADHGVNHERTEIKNPEGQPATHDLWTSCFTPRELRLLAANAGLKAAKIWSVTPGRYRRSAPTVTEPEFLMIATKA